MSSYTDDPYQELGVDVDADVATIKKAYRQLALAHHPDRPGGDSAKFTRVAAAYEILSDDYLRAEYNRSVATGSSSHPTEQDEGATPCSTKKKKKTSKKSKGTSDTEPPPPVFRYHFSDPYDVWKRDFKDMFGIEYPGAQHDWVSHDDTLTHDLIDKRLGQQHNGKSSHKKKAEPNPGQHGHTPSAAAKTPLSPAENQGSASSQTPMKSNNEEEKQPKKRGGFASLFRRKPQQQPEKQVEQAAEDDTKPTSTALIPFSKKHSKGSGTDTAGTTTCTDHNSQALVATTTTGRNNRPISMNVQTKKEGNVTITTTTLVRPDGSIETMTMRTGLPGPAVGTNRNETTKPLALTNGSVPDKALLSQDEKKKQKKIKTGSADQKLAITDGQEEKKTKPKKTKPTKSIESSSSTSHALVAID